MNVSRYDYSDNVYIYITHLESVPQNKYIRIAFEDNLEPLFEKEYSVGENKAICEKIVLENGKFNVKFSKNYGSYGTAYGADLWESEVTHKGMGEKINIGIPTHSILNILKNNTVKNAEIKNVHFAMKNRLLEIILADDPELADAQYDGRVRHELLKHKTVKREPGYKYVSVGSELNYLCDATMIAAKVYWYTRYGKKAYINEHSNFNYAIRCGRLPITLFVSNNDPNYKTSAVELFKNELEILDRSLEHLKKSKKVSSTDDLINSIDSYSKAESELLKSFMNNHDTNESLKLDNKKQSKKSMGKADAWLTDIDTIDIKSELTNFKNKCQYKLSEFIHKNDIPLPPEYLVYLIRFDNEKFIDITDYERDILGSVKRYCELSNIIHTDAHSKTWDSTTGNDYALRFLSYDISEINLLY